MVLKRSVLRGLWAGGLLGIVALIAFNARHPKKVLPPPPPPAGWPVHQAEVFSARKHPAEHDWLWDGRPLPAPPPEEKPKPPPPAPKDFGKLRLKVHPWAYVVIDGVDYGQGPRPEIRLPEGRHVVELVYPGPPVQRSTCEVIVTQYREAVCEGLFRIEEPKR